MNHLDIETIFFLAEKYVNKENYTNEELALLDHLKECGECYDKFCVALTLIKATSPEGIALALSGAGEDQQETTLNSNRTIAIIDVIKQRINDSINVVLEQSDNSDSIIKFETPIKELKSSLSEQNKLEKPDDEQTFILYDRIQDSLTVQLSTEIIDASDFFLYLSSQDDTTQIPVHTENGLMKGMIKGLPETNCKLIIECL